MLQRIESWREGSVARSPRADSPSFVVLIVAASATLSFEEELAALVSASGCIAPEAVRRAAILVWPLAPEAPRGALPRAALGAPLRDGTLLQAAGKYWVPPHSRVWFEGDRTRVEPVASEAHLLDDLLLSLARSWGPRSIAVLPMAAGGDGELGVRALRAAGGLALPSIGDAEGGALEAVEVIEPGVSLEPASAERGPGRLERSTRALVLPLELSLAAQAACRAELRRATPRGRLRAWVPRCGTGGLAYAVAMLLLREASRLEAPPRVTVFATDEDEDALAVARRGRYPVRAALGLEAELRGRYMFDEGDTLRVSEALRAICVFSRQHLAQDPPIGHVDLVIGERVFDGVPAARRPDLARALHHALGDGGSLLTSEPDALFERALFERFDGYLRARPLRAPAPACEPAPLELGLSPPASPEGPALLPFLASMGLPIVLCDAGLRLLLMTEEARALFGLDAAAVGAPLQSLASAVLAGDELVAAAERALLTQTPRELEIRREQRFYWVRIAVASRGLSLVFTDVTALELAKARAVAQQHQQAAIARLCELGSREPSRSALYEEALSALFGNVSGCGRGVILELRGGDAPDVVASRGLGDDPLQALGAHEGAARLLDGVLCRARRAQGGSGRPEGAEAAPLGGTSLALAAAAGAVVCPVTESGVVLAVIVLVLSAEGLDVSQQHPFIVAVAGVLGGAVCRQRARCAQALELEISAGLAAAEDLASAGRVLSSALGAALSAEGVELWCEAEDPAAPWGLAFRQPAEAPLEPPGAERLARARSALLESPAGDARELLLPLPKAPPAAVLRLLGARTLSHDSALSEAVQRIARMLAHFLERERILALARANEASQRQHGAELEAVYASLPVCVSIHDTGGAVRRISGQLSPAPVAPGSALPAGAAPIDQLYAEHIPAWVERVLETGEPVHDVELSLSEAEDSPCWLCNFAPIRDTEGELHGIVAVVHDITERKKVEAALRAADRQKDDFLAMLGHELRNPMAAIRNATELLGRAEGSREQLTRLRDIFDRQTAQTTHLLDGLLDIARVTRGKVDLQVAPLHIAELVRNVVDDHKPRMMGRTLTLRAPDEPLWVVADRARMHQIVDNLISNAIKFTPPSGHLSIEVAETATGGLLCVRDDGIGIDRELLPSIFEPFRQGQVKSMHGGLGLGLALVKGLVELHGFELEAHSDGPGRGASFSIRFPLTRPPRTQPPPSRVEVRGLGVLIVEDEPDIADTLAELLTSFGHRVERVGCAEAALEAVRRKRVDVVLCDIGLPGMDGLELAERLRADPELSGVELVAMTGFGDPSTVRRVEHSAFDRLLVKPVRLDELNECLAEIASGPRSAVSRR